MCTKNNDIITYFIHSFLVLLFSVSMHRNLKTLPNNTTIILQYKIWRQSNLKIDINKNKYWYYVISTTKKNVKISIVKFSKHMHGIYIAYFSFVFILKFNFWLTMVSTRNIFIRALSFGYKLKMFSKPFKLI